VPFFAELPRIELLYLRGNPCVRKIANYRKVMITTIPALIYFDERNVDKLERMFAEAFMRGGKEEEIRIRDEYAEGQRQIRSRGLAIAKEITEKKAV
jgi:dynein assembly factor 1, axonemal